MLIVCEGEGSTPIECSTSIHIISAVYGRTDEATCPSSHIKTSQCLDDHALSMIRQLCENKKSCHVNANNDLYGDPCPGTYKYLNITFHCTGKYDGFIDCLFSNVILRNVLVTNL